MNLTIALRKEVPDVETAEALLTVVKAKLADHPEVVISGSVSEILGLEVPE